MFHELGHAITYELTEEFGLYRILPASYDEAMAVVIEKMAPMLLLNEAEQNKLQELSILEYTRCAISALFEFHLWEDISRAEEFYVKDYEELGVKIKNPILWVCDTFRSLDPVYIHNYVIGAAIADPMIEFLKQTYSGDYEKWGQWLYAHIYQAGRKVAFFDKIKEIVDYL